MRKGITIVAAAVIALAIAAPTASAYTHAQQDALLNSLKAKLNCLTKTPVTEFGDPAGSDWGYVWDNVDADNTISGTFGASALDFAFGSANPDAWLVTVKPTSACKAKFATTPKPAWWPARNASSEGKAQAVRLLASR